MKVKIYVSDEREAYTEAEAMEYIKDRMHENGEELMQDFYDEYGTMYDSYIYLAIFGETEIERAEAREIIKEKMKGLQQEIMEDKLDNYFTVSVIDI